MGGKSHTNPKMRYYCLWLLFAFVLCSLVWAEPECENAMERNLEGLQVVFYTNGGNTTGPQGVQRTVTDLQLDKEWAGQELGLAEEKYKTANLYDRFGKIVEEMSVLQEGQPLYIVPKNEWFIWPAPYIGYEVEVEAGGRKYLMETLLVRPRLFRIRNWVNDTEIDELISIAKQIMVESFVMDSNDPTKTAKDAARTSQQAWAQIPVTTY